jgi:hypothetical protein
VRRAASQLRIAQGAPKKKKEKSDVPACLPFF